MLYVEDDDDNLEVAEYRLAESYDVIRAATAEEACRIVRVRRNEIDLIHYRKARDRLAHGHSSACERARERLNQQAWSRHL